MPSGINSEAHVCLWPIIVKSTFKRNGQAQTQRLSPQILAVNNRSRRGGDGIQLPLVYFDGLG